MICNDKIRSSMFWHLQNAIHVTLYIIWHKKGLYSLVIETKCAQKVNLTFFNVHGASVLTASKNHCLLATHTLPDIPFFELSSICRLLAHDIHKTHHAAWHDIKSTLQYCIYRWIFKVHLELLQLKFMVTVCVTPAAHTAPTEIGCCYITGRIPQD